MHNKNSIIFHRRKFSTFFFSWKIIDKRISFFFFSFNSINEKRNVSHIIDFSSNELKEQKEERHQSILKLFELVEDVHVYQHRRGVVIDIN